MTVAELRFAFSEDGSHVCATIGETVVLEAILVGDVDDERKARIGDKMTALVLECLEGARVPMTQGGDA